MDSERGASHEARKRVLVADDDPTICALVARVLEFAYDVICVSDAEEALAAIDSQAPFDAIVSDFMLPGITGIDLVRHVRRGERGRHVPILMISGHGSREVGENARAAGVDAFLDKPFTVGQLRTTIEQLLAVRAHTA